ncbi:MAG: ATPase [Spirochaetaceae bacterium]|nr:ATPase [Spirochaetaceae bacterium]
MIVPMKKVSFVVLEAERKEALKKLRKLGVVHLERLNGNSAALASFRDSYNTIDRANMILSEIKLAKNVKLPTVPSFDREQVLAKAEEIIALSERKKQCVENIASYTSELERFRFWGDLDSADFNYLAEKGILLSMYEIPRDAYISLPETLETIVVNESKSQVRFLLIQHTDGSIKPEAAIRPSDLPAEAFAIPMISTSTKQLCSDIESMKKEIVTINEALESAVAYKSYLQKCGSIVSKDIEFENAFSGMGKEISSEEEKNIAPLAWLSGFVPTVDLPAVQVVAQQESWAMVATDPTEEDEVPTKLKNNKFVSLIYPVSDFLGTVPGYREYDISAWFLLFFCVFFGIIFGDGGYGLLMVVVALLADIFAIIKGKKIPAAYNLLFLLGLTTMAWGTVTCTWFGILPEMLPDWLKALSFQPISNAYSALSPENEAYVKQNLQIFCFMLALIQLSIAHLKGIIRFIRSPKCLGELGSLLMVWGMFFVVLNMVVKVPVFFGVETMGLPVIAIIGVGFLLSFVFANYEGSLGASILDSCKNIVSVILGVVNVFSDIVSYIRLWAVGLAGSAISSTINDMAGPTLGGALIFAGILLLVFGHGLNMILNVLSVIVHGVRLNTLEFSSHLGMSWSGFSYEPFCESADNK